MKHAWILSLLLLGAVHTITAASSASDTSDTDHGLLLDKPLVFEVETVTNATPSGHNTTDNSTYPEYVGFITAGIAVIFYGSNFVPVKKFDTGDGE